ncbi:hypothetical protein LTR64_000900 [Lithohypha guttulata]|uniref:uncharacterized protein n=1 Tax=Lithohypha guttulata TaxID=1690604 RepID=UPI002DDE4ED0|nr:hypothetical protein LTR51_003094 [Lithohypha guttulata]
MASSEVSDHSDDQRLSKTVFCVKAKVECQYLGQPRKRGLRAGYVTELESRIESLQGQFDALKNSLTSTPVVTTSATPSLIIEPQQQFHLPEISPAANSFPRKPINGTSRHLAERNGAVADLMSLPSSYFHTLADFWFKEDHNWLPILEYERIQASLAELPDTVDYIPDVVLRAVIALKIEYSSQAISLGYKGRRRLSLHLRSEVLTEAMANPSLSSIQALFIIALLDFGSDNIPSTFNIMSMCRRTGEHIGIFRQLLQRIEAQSPHQVGPPSRETFTSGNSQVAQTWGILAFDAASSLGVSWQDKTAALIDHLSGIAYVTAPDFRDSFVTHVHLAAIGLQPVHDFFLSFARGRHQVLEGETMTATEDIYHNSMSYIRGMPTSGYTILADGAVDFDINHIFTRLLAHAAVIMIYQRYVLDNENQNIQLARDRCMESYHQIIDVVRNMSDADTEINSPAFAHFVAQAIRFRLALERGTGFAREAVFDILMHAINMCARRWPLARRLDVVFRAALAEIDSQAPLGLPEEFWDLKKSTHDISESLKTWVNTNKELLWLRNLNGPYA